MSVESATKISQLNAAWPLGSDQKAEGDDHIRLIKSVLKSTFPADFKAPTQQVFTAASGTWTKPAGCTHVMVTAVGGGGGGQGLTGAASQYGAGAGGGSGAFGSTPLIDVTAVTSATVTIGNAGGPGVTGGTTLITLGATSYSWAGGGSGSNTGPTAAGQLVQGFAGGAGTNVVAAGNVGQPGIAIGAMGVALSGAGASSPWGVGGVGQRQGSGTTSGGASGTGYGAGGSGGAAAAAGAVNGGAGSPGRMVITEYYGFS